MPKSKKITTTNNGSLQITLSPNTMMCVMSLQSLKFFFAIQMDNNNYKMLFFWKNGNFQTKNEMCKQQKWQKLKKKKLIYCSGRFLKKGTIKKNKLTFLISKNAD